MRDPLEGFDWATLYERYDAKCTRFRPDSEWLQAVRPHVSSDRALYCYLNGQLSSAVGLGWRMTVGNYMAMLYWKLYSQPAALANLGSWLAPDQRVRESPILTRLVAALPASLERNVELIQELVRTVGRFGVFGMKSGLPVRTTFLHFLYPNIVPIFDQMVLKAVGAWHKGANQKLDALREYIPFAWQLADQHTRQLTGFPETPVRLVDMALWVVRGTHPHSACCSA